MVEDPSLSLNEWVVLALVGEQQAHGFALARELAPTSDLGRVLTVHRPLVYRALARLVEYDLVEHHRSGPGDAGPKRRTHRITPKGRRARDRWLERPVDHVRDMRIEFLVKLRLNERAGRNTSRLVAAQHAQLAATLDRLEHEPPCDVVDRWRQHNAAAVRDFLADLGG